MENTNLKKSERTRQFIIETAAPIFNRKGLAGTTLSDLTQATGLTKGSIYGNFKDKDDVAIHVFQYHIDTLVSVLTRAMDRETTCMGKLLALPAAYRKLWPHILDYGGCPIMNTATEADDTHNILCRMTIDVIEGIKREIIGLVETGRSSGEIRLSVEPEKTADIIIALIEGGLFLSKLTGQTTYIEHALEQVETLIRASAAWDTL